MCQLVSSCPGAFGCKPSNVLSGLEHLRTHEYVGESLRMPRTVARVGCFRTRVPSKMPNLIEASYEVSLKTAKDPDGGPCLAYPSGKSWDEVTGKMGSGKFYHNVTSGADFVVQT